MRKTVPDNVRYRSEKNEYRDPSQTRSGKSGKGPQCAQSFARTGRGKSSTSGRLKYR